MKGIQMPSKGGRDNSGVMVENPLASTADLPLSRSDTNSQGGSGRIVQSNPQGTIKEKL